MKDPILVLDRLSDRKLRHASKVLPTERILRAMRARWGR